MRWADAPGVGREHGRQEGGGMGLRTYRPLALTVLVALAGLAPAWAGEGGLIPVPTEADARVLELKTGSVNTRAADNLLTAEGVQLDPAGRYVAQLDGPLTPEREALLVAAGIRLGDYLPNYAYIVRLTDAALAAARQLPFLTWVGAYDRSWKLDPTLGLRPNLTDFRANLATGGQTQVVIMLFDGEDAASVVDELLRRGAIVLGANQSDQQWLIDALLPPADASALADLAAVQYIEDAPQGTFRNDTNRWIVQSNVSGATPVWDQGIHGEGQIAGLIDGTVYEAHCMFDDSVAVGPTHRKLIAMRNAGTVNSHGTHTAGTLAGDASPYGTYTTNDGLAFAAKISFSEVNAVYSSPSTLYQRLVDAHTDGARVHSNSWGDDGTTAYTTWSRQIDQFSYNYEDSLVAFAVSNGSAVTTPENAKDVLAVAASLDTPNQGSLCSGGTGPTADGRRRPEVFAPGCSTVSADALTTCGTRTMTGTSMACPAVAGAGVLVRQYFTEGFYPTGARVPANAFVPTGALLKAVLINSAVDMTGISGYPSNQEGWGRVLLAGTLYFAGATRGLIVQDVRNASGLTTGQTATYTFNVTGSTAPLHLTLVWTEPPAAVNAANPVINNLDLEVTAPGSVLYRGNVFASGQSTTGGTADAKNNVEQVYRLAPALGAYTVTVRGAAINQGTQGYALVVTGNVSTCTAPQVTGQPTAATRGLGGSATFTVTATGSATLSYQWRKNGNNIDGATDNSYTLNPVHESDAGSYDCVVSNGCGTDTSAPAVLTLTLPAACPGDANCDGAVNWRDIDFLIAGLNDSIVAWETLFTPVPSCPFAALDTSGDGHVNWRDIDPFIARMNTTCP